MAVHLHRKSPDKYSIIVALVSGPCSRPMPLKKFLYLDFFDKEKRKGAWDMFTRTLSTCGFLWCV